MLLLAETSRYTRGAISEVATFAQLAAAIALLAVAGGGVPGVWPDGVGVYLVGDWPAPFGIVLVVDRLAAVMLTLTAVLGLATLIYALARWDRAGCCWRHPMACCCTARALRGSARGCNTSP
ncbi:hypothetical protein G6F68_017623 [Rhizopus microsporus]|nr:hypothetical protein G6F68_017623 [Rhizopus microsporus]